MSVEQRDLARKLCRAFWGDELAAFYERHGDGRWSEALQAADRFSDLTRAETPQSIPSEREEIVKWLRSLRLEPLMPDDIADVIEGGEHTRQALEQGSAE